ncbi:MAG: putative Ig domain-containing protein, partial [Actinobacteria bacterium]|nr:putative Ig domain-containing protein [Actinomycetota bacterium]
MPFSRLRQRAMGIAIAVFAVALAAIAPSGATAIPPTADPQFIQVAASRYSPYISPETPYGFVVALTADGELYSWGTSTAGALGLGATMLSTSTPTRIDLTAVVPPDDRVIQLAAGATSVLALTDQGRVLAWGDNWYGQLGVGDRTPRYLPTLVPESSFPGLGPGQKIISIAAGASDWAMALSNSSSVSSGAVYAWGDNSFGQLGNTGVAWRLSPVQVSPLTQNVKLIAAGSASGYAVNNAGSLYSWGNNSYGQLNRGNYSSQSTPTVRTGGYGSAKIVKIAAGGEHVIAITENNQVYTWGDNSGGQLGNNSTTERPTAVNITGSFMSIPGGGALAGISAGASHSLALTTSGAVIAWGDNSYGQLGRGGTTTEYVPRQVFDYPAVSDGAPISSITAGDYSSFVTTSTGGVYGTGVQGAFGDAGNAEYDPDWDLYRFSEALSFTPIRLSGLSGSVTVAPQHPVEGIELTASPSGFGSSATIAYQWRRDGTDISGADAQSYTVVAADVGHEITVKARASAENRGAASAISAPIPVGSAPEITTSALPQTKPGILYQQTVSAQGSTPISYSSADLPAWLTLDADTGLLHGISPEQTGTASFSVTATND